jgi:hypothetical protein
MLIAYNDQLPVDDVPAKHQGYFVQSLRLINPDDQQRTREILDDPQLIRYDLESGGVSQALTISNIFFRLRQSAVCL